MKSGYICGLRDGFVRLCRLFGSNSEEKNSLRYLLLVALVNETHKCVRVTVDQQEYAVARRSEIVTWHCLHNLLHVTNVRVILNVVDQPWKVKSICGRFEKMAVLPVRPDTGRGFAQLYKGVAEMGERMNALAGEWPDVSHLDIEPNYVPGCLRYHVARARPNLEHKRGEVETARRIYDEHHPKPQVEDEDQKGREEVECEEDDVVETEEGTEEESEGDDSVETEEDEEEEEDDDQGFDGGRMDRTRASRMASVARNEVMATRQVIAARALPRTTSWPVTRFIEYVLSELRLNDPFTVVVTECPNVWDGPVPDLIADRACYEIESPEEFEFSETFDPIDDEFVVLYDPEGIPEESDDEEDSEGVEVDQEIEPGFIIESEFVDGDRLRAFHGFRAGRDCVVAKSTTQECVRVVGGSDVTRDEQERVCC